MNILRDPIWQFVGVIVTILIAIVPVIIWRLRHKKAEALTHQQQIIAELKAHIDRGHHSIRHQKHKKRQGDGLLLGNLSFDFFNQFPVPIGVLAAHLDQIYTPENFGADNWLAVFRRLASEGYFESADGSSWKRVRLNTPLILGGKMEHWVKIAADIKRTVAGLE